MSRPDRAYESSAETLERLGWFGKSRVFKTYAGLVLGAIGFAWSIALLDGMFLYVATMSALFVFVGRRSSQQRERLPEVVQVDAMVCVMGWAACCVFVAAFVFVTSTATPHSLWNAPVWSGLSMLALYVAFATPLFPGWLARQG